jgi:TRAP-type mannitol/chloroaromatic compound transport system permease large subunit
MGLLATPALLNKGYQKEMTSGIICAAGTLGILIPPSIMMVIYGGLTGLKETSVGNLFAGAILPGLILAGLYFMYILIRCNLNPELGPPISARMRPESWSAAQKWAMTLKSLVPPLALILAVMGTILAGIATPTEAAGLGAAGAALLAIFNKKMNWPVVRDSSYATMKTTVHGDDALHRRQVLQHGVPEHGRRRRGGRPHARLRIRTGGWCYSS